MMYMQKNFQKIAKLTLTFDEFSGIIVTTTK